MFYLKTKDGQKVEFEGEFYTNCPYCGKELVIDLGEFDDLNDFDCYGTSFFCGNKCLHKYQATKVFMIYPNE